MDNVASVAAGGWSAFAIKNNGDLYYWGSNYYGTFGNGRFMKDNDSPVLKPTKSKMTDVVAVFAGGCTYFMKSDGSLWGCGSSNGLGNGNKSNAIARGDNMPDVPIQTVPVKILDNVKKP